MIKKMLKDKQVSEDDERKGLEEVQKLTDQYAKKIEELAKKKEEEILTV
jgi:ribosome recycling factor